MRFRESRTMRKLRALGLGRFQVMALLQAARYYVLKGDVGKAKSFGLNRAIFYAWAKYYGPSKGGYALRVEELLRRGIKDVKVSKCPEGYVEELGECVQLGSEGLYKIGDKVQRPEDFDHQVLRKIKQVVGDERRVWDAAVKYVSNYPEWVLRDPRRFYKLVYEPIRDEFLAMLADGKEPQPPKDIIDRVRASDRVYEESKKKQRSLTDYIGGKR